MGAIAGANSKKKSVVVGYYYHMNIHAAVCHTPDAVRAFVYGEREAWAGNITGNTQVLVNQPELFGGESREGGPVGYMDIMFGGDTQPVNDLLLSKRPDAPAYRGILSVLFRGSKKQRQAGGRSWLPSFVFGPSRGGFTWSAMNPYLKPFWFKVKHIFKDRPWYTAKAAIGDDMNPAHIIYDAMTNAKYALGFSSSLMNDAAFKVAADKLFDEGFGISIVWMGSTSAWDFIQTILDHINGLMYVDPETGLFTLKLARDDYDIDDLITLDASNILDFSSFERASWGEIVNQVSVEYTDPATESVAVVTVQNPAAIGAQGGRVISSELKFHGIRNADLALRVAMRHLRMVSGPIVKVSLEINRIGYDLRPGDVVKLDWPPLGISGMALRVAEIDYGTLTDGRIKLDAVEDVFGMSSTVYAGGETGGWTDPVVAPVVISEQRALEASFYEINRAEAPSVIADFDPAFGFAQVLAVRPQESMVGYDIATAPSAGGDYTAAGMGSFVPTAKLLNAIGPTDTAFDLTDFDHDDDMITGAWGYLGNEAVEYLGYNESTGKYEFNRAVIDTVPVAHPAGTRIYFNVEGVGIDPTERISGETVYYKLLTRNGLGTVPLASATAMSLTLAQRYQRPYPPGNFKINGLSFPSSVAYGPVTATWAHRDRTQQTAGLTLQSTGNIGPEAGTTYNVRVYNATTGTLLHSANTAGTSYTYSADYTRVLLHFDGDDNSTTIVDEKGHTFTCFGNAKLSVANKKFGPTALVLDGTGDYIRASTSPDFNFLTSGFQVEAQVMRAASKLQIIATNRNTSGGTVGWSFSITAANYLNFTVWNTGGSTYLTLASSVVVPTTMSHVAASFDGTTARLFIDGVLVGSTTSVSGTPSTSTQPFYIGRDPYDTARDFNGVIDEFRLMQGNATYVSAFTPPSYPYGVDVMPSELRVEVESLRDGLSSMQKQSATFSLITSDRLLEDGTTRIAEDGSSRKLEQE